MPNQSPPSDVDAEIAVLGGILLESAALSDIIQDLRPYEFYRENHGKVYEAMVNLYSADEPIDNITVSRELHRMGDLDRIGGRGYIATLYAQAITSKHVAHYSAIIKDKAKKREVIGILRKGLDDCMEDREDSRSILNNVTRELFDRAIEESDTNGIEHVGGNPVAEAKRHLYALKAGNAPQSKVRYPWATLDKILPIRDGEVTVVAGRPSMGKSAFALNLACHLAIRSGVAVGFFSLEMPVRILMQRMAAELSGVSTTNIERGIWDDDDFNKVIKAYDTIGSAPFYYDDTPALDEATLIAKARAAKFKYDIKLFILDYLSLMDGKGNSDNERVGGCAKTVRKLARHLRTPFIEVCQLSRAPEGRPDKRPILSDLRDSGNIEQEADVAIGLYRDDYYTRENSSTPGQVEVIVMKHRNGQTGMVPLYWQKQITTFKEIERHQTQ